MLPPTHRSISQAHSRGIFGGRAVAHVSAYYSYFEAMITSFGTKGAAAEFNSADIDRLFMAVMNPSEGD